MRSNPSIEGTCDIQLRRLSPAPLSNVSPYLPAREAHMSEKPSPIAIVAADAPKRTRPSNYPAPFVSRVAGREKHPLGDLFGLTNLGVNLTCTSRSATEHQETKGPIRMTISRYRS